MFLLHFIRAYNNVKRNNYNLKLHASTCTQLNKSTSIFRNIDCYVR